MTRIVKKHDGYWIVELPCNTPDCGPYDKKYGPNSASEDMQGMEEFFLYEWEPTPDRKKVKRKRLT